MNSSLDWPVAAGYPEALLITLIGLFLLCVFVFYYGFHKRPFGSLGSWLIAIASIWTALGLVLLVYLFLH